VRERRMGQRMGVKVTALETHSDNDVHFDFPRKVGNRWNCFPCFSRLVFPLLVI
jgi:hypothetical protein